MSPGVNSITMSLLSLQIGGGEEGWLLEVLCVRVKDKIADANHNGEQVKIVGGRFRRGDGRFFDVRFGLGFDHEFWNLSSAEQEDVLNNPEELAALIERIKETYGAAILVEEPEGAVPLPEELVEKLRYDGGKTPYKHTQYRAVGFDCKGKRASFSNPLSMDPPLEIKYEGGEAWFDDENGKRFYIEMFIFSNSVRIHGLILVLTDKRCKCDLEIKDGRSAWGVAVH
ncbi:MAG: hypothetical protein ACOX3T_00415 [Bdellovibrionota bacterium]